jgi:hypothetical protein
MLIVHISPEKQRTEVRGQMTEVRGQMTEIRKQSSAHLPATATASFITKKLCRLILEIIGCGNGFQPRLIRSGIYP